MPTSSLLALACQLAKPELHSDYALRKDPAGACSASIALTAPTAQVSRPKTLLRLNSSFCPDVSFHQNNLRHPGSYAQLKLFRVAVLRPLCRVDDLYLAVSGVGLRPELIFRH